jgi:KDO2-lipid IV(A) lauroyltransferase
MVKFYLYRIAQTIVNVLPLKISYFLSCVLADILYFVCYRDRGYVKHNLEYVVDDKRKIKALTKGVFRNFAKYLVEFFRILKDVDQQFIEKKVVIKDKKYLDKIQKENQGAIFITAHMGNWELGGAVLNSLGFPLTAVALPHMDRPVNELFNEQRRAKGIEVVPKNLAIRRCLEVLKNKKFIGLVADRTYGAKSEEVKFFGRLCSLPIGPAMFSLKMQVPIVPVFFIREDYKFVLTICEPIYPKKTSSKNAKEEVRRLMKEYILILEKHIKQFPTQWLVFRKFWAI